MKLKKLGMALVVVLAFGAVMASSALAAATTEDKQWYTGASPGTLLTGSQAVTASGSMQLFSSVGTTTLTLKSTGLECIECKIENSGGTAVGSGKLKFTGVTAIEPAVCAVEGGSVTTVGLKIKADYMIETENYVLFEPASGTTFATFRLIKGSGSCPISGTYALTGSVFVKSNNATGVFAASQGVTASGAINTAAGGALDVGAKPAELEGTASFALSSGKEFATK